MATLEHRNELGKSKWQPMLTTGEILFKRRTYASMQYGDPQLKVWINQEDQTEYDTPKLYRSKARALRVARRFEKWFEKESLKPSPVFEPVQ